MLNYVTANSVKCMLPMFADFQIRYYGQVKMKSADVPRDQAAVAARYVRGGVPARLPPAPAVDCQL